jgi:hypothetical protein
MSVLEQITEMKNQGIQNEEIMNKLTEKGISKNEITEALSQSQIKNAVSDNTNPETLQPSIMEQGNSQPMTQEMSEQETYSPQQAQEYYPPQEGYPQENYQEGYSPEGVDTNTIMEISEQVFSEKIREMEKQVDKINEFKVLTETKVENISERLKKIEKIIDKLQISILDKVGSYGKNLEGIKKEMSMMQDSFGKVINPVLDKTEKKHLHKTIKHHKKTSKRK